MERYVFDHPAHSYASLLFSTSSVSVNPQRSLLHHERKLISITGPSSTSPSPSNARPRTITALEWAVRMSRISCPTQHISQKSFQPTSATASSSQPSLVLDLQSTTSQPIPPNCQCSRPPSHTPSILKSPPLDQFGSQFRPLYDPNNPPSTHHVPRTRQTTRVYTSGKQQLISHLHYIGVLVMNENICIPFIPRKADAYPHAYSM